MKNLLKKLIPVKFRLAVIGVFYKIFALVCRILPLKNRAVFFTVRSNGTLLDNSKCVYDALDAPKVVFAHKAPHSHKVSFLAYYYLLTNKVIVTDDYIRYARELRLRKGQKVFQLWHACGAFKMFGLDAPSKLTPEQEKATHACYDAVAVTSESCRKFYAGAFGISEKKCLSIGLPRTDMLFTKSDNMRSAVYQRHPEFNCKRLYLYCPTFREDGGNRVEYDPMIDWAELSASLKDDEVFIIRRHPMMNYSFIKESYNNIFDLTDESTLELTAASDVIITDYSSVIYDACLLGVPTVFYCPDYKKYERGFYLRFPDDLPGEIVTDSAELLSCIRRTKENPPALKIEKFKSEQLSACDGNSTQRAAKIIEGWLK